MFGRVLITPPINILQYQTSTCKRFYFLATLQAGSCNFTKNDVFTKNDLHKVS